jgi:hypothetical protein
MIVRVVVIQLSRFLGLSFTIISVVGTLRYGVPARNPVQGGTNVVKCAFCQCVPSPDAAPGNGDRAARRPYLNLIPFFKTLSYG